MNFGASRAKIIIWCATELPWQVRDAVIMGWWHACQYSSEIRRYYSQLCFTRIASPLTKILHRWHMVIKKCAAIDICTQQPQNNGKTDGRALQFIS